MRLRIQITCSENKMETEVINDDTNEVLGGNVTPLSFNASLFYVTIPDEQISIIRELPINAEVSEPTATPATIRFESGGKIYEERL